jgi:general stress protein YciG
MKKRGFFTKENAAHFGKRGGEATVAAHGAEHMRALAARGGEATAAAYGRTHMQRIGRAGFWATVEKHYNGDAAAFINALIAKGLLALDPMPYNTAWQPHEDGSVPQRVRVVTDRREQASNGDSEDLPF